MKRIVYIAILLISNFCFSQGYEARVTASHTVNNTFTHIITVTYTAYNGGTQLDQYTFNDSNNNAPPTAFLYSPSLAITRITISYNINQVEGSNFGDCNVTQTINVTNPDCFTWSWTNCANLGVRVYNTQQSLIQPTNNTICVDDLLPLSAGNGCSSNLYVWEYTTNITDPFQSLGVQSSGTNTVNVNLSGFLGASYTGNVFIRARVNGNFTNTITYTVISCTPGITSVVTTPTSCSQNSDGSFTITFDEALSNQQILFELRRDSFTGPIESSFTATITGTNYAWPNPLPARDYFLEYQATPTGSVVQYSPITIVSPTAVLFTAGWTDVDCFGENTGSISINASGGQGNYQYSTNNGSNWFSFSTAVSHNITNLPAGNYQVKVRDGNNCIAQQ